MSADELVRIELPVLRCPVCSTPYVLRVAFALRGSELVSEWVYQPDHGPVCKRRHPLAENPVDTEWIPAGVARRQADDDADG